MIDVDGNLNRVRTRIREACIAAGRSEESVQLLAVSKTKPTPLVEAALQQGQVHFGENYLQDALTKIESINHPDVEWHFIGAIQSNKTRQIAEHFDWVHTVGSSKVARRLNDQRPENKPPIKVFLQVNIDQDEAKSGFLDTEIEAAIAEVKALPRLDLQGLMTLPRQRQTTLEQRQPFAALRNLQLTHCKDQNELSMGMSGDLEAAILEGATWVRIGTDIFGARSQS